MALLYPWATKEYVLWKMTIGQVILYIEIANELKNPKQENESGFGSYDEVKNKKEELRKLYGAV